MSTFGFIGRLVIWPAPIPPIHGNVDVNVTTRIAGLGAGGAKRSGGAWLSCPAALFCNPALGTLRMCEL